MLKIAFDKIYKHPLDENHRFPMIKYDLIPEQLLRENTCNHENFFIPSSLKDNNVLLTHDEDYYHRFSSLLLTKKEIRPIGFPMSEELVIREKKIAQGTIECVNFSIKNGISMNIAGGTHHAFCGEGAGYCIFNDLAVCAEVALQQRNINRILVLDLDVHQGDGTAEIFASDERVYTVSLHGENNFPFRKKRSDLDIGFPDGTKDEKYLDSLESSIRLLKIMEIEGDDFGSATQKMQMYRRMEENKKNKPKDPAKGVRKIKLAQGGISALLGE